jgi:hypothetical protein
VATPAATAGTALPARRAADCILVRSVVQRRNSADSGREELSAASHRLCGSYIVRCCAAQDLARNPGFKQREQLP